MTLSGPFHQPPLFRILGPVEVVHDDAPAPIRGKPLRLLSLLLVAREAPLSPDRAIDALWGAKPPRNPENALQVIVTRLRAELGSAGVELRAGGYALTCPPETIDAVQFEELLTRGRAESSDGDADAAAETLRSALALWRGPALAGVRDEPFAHAEAARLDELRLEALELRVDADLHLGRASELVGELTSLVDTHPLRERLRHSLMLALARSGRQAEALAAFADARQVLHDQLGLEPSTMLHELQRAVLNQEPHTAPPPTRAPSRPGEVPPTAPFIGRSAELAETTGLLLRGGRVLTLVGPGGTGKTRLASELAAGLRDAFPGGIVSVALAPLRGEGDVYAAVTRALAGERSSHDASLEAIAAAATGRLCLVVLDNAEHVSDAAARAATALVGVDGPRVLVTSRVRLGVRAETTYAVPPLTPADAASLFVACARRLDPAFSADEAVPLLCARLDRLPLAIELAAARTTVFSPAQLLDRLGERLDMATVDPEVEERHRSLRATTEWSLAGLSEAEAALFRRLSVFAGPVSWETIETVCSASPETISTLVELSLVVRDAEVPTPRFSMLETIRQHAGELLAADPAELASVRLRHAETMRDRARLLSEGAAPPLALEQERSELALALATAREQESGELELSIAIAMHRLWRLRGPSREGIEALEQALDRVDAHEERAHGLVALADLVSLAGDPGAARGYAEAAVTASDPAGGHETAVRALNVLGNALYGSGDLEGAKATYERAIELERPHGITAVLLAPLSNLGHTLYELGNLADARRMLEDCLIASLRIGDRQRVSACLHSLGILALDEGRLAEADEACRAGLAIARELGIVKYQIDILGILGAVKVGRGETSEGVTLVACSEHQAAAVGISTDFESGREGVVRRDALRDALERLGPAAFETAFAAGRELGLDVATATSLGASDPS